jgi:hypothetical protein
MVDIKSNNAAIEIAAPHTNDVQSFIVGVLLFNAGGVAH